MNKVDQVECLRLLEVALLGGAIGLVNVAGRWYLNDGASKPKIVTVDQSQGQKKGEPMSSVASPTPSEQKPTPTWSEYLTQGISDGYAAASNLASKAWDLLPTGSLPLAISAYVLYQLYQQYQKQAGHGSTVIHNNPVISPVFEPKFEVKPEFQVFITPFGQDGQPQVKIAQMPYAGYPTPTGYPLYSPEEKSAKDNL